MSGFSYQRLADQIGITAPSIHHHFKHKEDLVAEVARLYRAEFANQVGAINAPATTDRLPDYGQLFVTTASRDLLPHRPGSSFANLTSWCPLVAPSASAAIATALRSNDDCI